MSELLLGAHTSAAGGVHNAIYEGKAIGATTVQLFTANQRQWKARSIAQDEVDLFQRALLETGLSHIMSHDSYLINLGASDPEILTKSRAAFRAEIIRCLQLGITYLNFHPGAALKDPVELCLQRIVESLKEMKDLFTGKEPLQLLVESTAGQGSTVGWKFEELGFIVHALKHDLPIGICIDTCHAFAAGYDIRTKEGVERVVDDFDEHVGLKYLKAFHLNDSQKGLGSRVDRHAQLGEGMIGIECFRAIMQHPKLKSLPKYLETPNPEIWEKEIQLLRSFV
ncbi:MAG: nfo [Chlamydiia bacterium]|nr:nfo [Chlamydiia bacterium]